MFLKPTAKPTPRWTPSPRVVLPAPPGRRIASRGSGLGLRRRQRGRAADHLGGRQRAVDPLARRQDVARLQRVQEPELDRVDVERGGELVHLRLGREARLHGAEAAHRAAGRVVRVDAGRFDQRVLDRIRADRERRGVRGDRRRARGVRAAVQQDPHADVDELSGARRAVLAPDPRGVPVDVADERLLPVVDDLHGPVRVQREHRAVELHGEVLAAAERAADAGEVDPHHLGRQPEARCDLVAVDVQPLRRDVDVDAALAVGHGEAGLRPEERLVLDADVVDARDDDLALGVRDRRAGSSCGARRSGVGRRSSRATSSAGRDGAAPARWRAPCR